MFAAPFFLLALQQWSLGPTTTFILDAGDGVARECYEQGYASELGARLVAPISKRLSLQASARHSWMAQSASCAAEPFFLLPSDGTFTETDTRSLQAASFATSDLRLAWSSPHYLTSYAIGGGKAWHAGHDLPYVLIAWSANLVNGPAVRFGFGLEYQRLWVTADRVSRTYQNEQLISQQSLGQVHSKSHIVALGLHLDIPF